MNGRKYDDKDLQRVVGIISEQLDDKFAVLTENLETMVIWHTQPIKEDVKDLKQDMKIVKAAVTATNHDIKNHEIRISRLEATA